MTRAQRIRRTVIVSCAAIAVAAVVIASVDASEESRAGATTAVALALGVYIRGQWQRWRQTS
ncbi:MAG TPA: hypothetical protein VF715_06515 [Thermoleophilaceae bacterium]|jgi:hypothetical protein